MDVGTTLRTAREQRGIPLPRLAATTKIPVTLLRAIEDNDFGRVPAGIFVRGYIRACAREVGLEPEAVVAQYLAETGHAAPAIGAPGGDHPVAAETIDTLERDPDLTETSRADWGYVLIVAALLIGFVSATRNGEQEAAAPAAAPRVAQTVPAADVQVLPAAEERPVATTGAAIRIELHAEGLCWIRAVSEGEKLVERLLQPGERHVIEADGDVLLRVGDPGALRHSVNGTPGEPLGRPGMPVTVRFTNDGRHVLAS